MQCLIVQCMHAWRRRTPWPTTWKRSWRVSRPAKKRKSPSLCCGSSRYFKTRYLNYGRLCHFFENTLSFDYQENYFPKRSLFLFSSWDRCESGMAWRRGRTRTCLSSRPSSGPSSSSPGWRTASSRPFSQTTLASFLIRIRLFLWIHLRYLIPDFNPHYKNS